MAPPDQRTTLMARAFVWRLTHGFTIQDATNHIATEYGHPSNEMIAAALALAQRGMDVVRNIGYLNYNQPISRALGGQTPPAQTVGIQILVDFDISGGARHHYPFYLDVPWSITQSQIGALVYARIKAKYPNAKFTYEFEGETVSGIGWRIMGSAWLPASSVPPSVPL